MRIDRAPVDLPFSVGIPKKKVGANPAANAQNYRYPKPYQKKTVSQFRCARLKPCEPICAGFYCPSERLAIELDGEHHFTASGLLKDEERTAHLNALKVNVLRFENEEIFQSPEAVLAEIKKHFLHD